MNFELMKNRRKELGMTQQDLADECGLSKTTIFNYESGRFEPTKDNIKKLSVALGISEIDLILSEPFDYIETILNGEIDFNDIEIELENSLFEKIVDFLYLDEQIKLLEKKEIKFIVDKLLKIIKIILNFDTIIYSEITNNVIFHRENSSKNKPCIKRCSFELFISTFKNILSIIDNQIFTEYKNDTENNYYKILKAENDFLDSLNNLYDAKLNLNDELKRSLEIFKACNNNDELIITDEKMKTLDNKFKEIKEIMDKKYPNNYKPIDESLKKEVEKEYSKIKLKYLEQKYKEGGSNE